MIDEGFLNNLVSDPKWSSFRRRTAEFIQNRLGSNEPATAFNYTDIMLAGEPFQTTAFMHLDGVGLAPGNVPRANEGEIHQSVEPVVIVALDPTRGFRHPAKKKLPIPGRKELRTESYMAEFPNFAAVPDLFPERLARMIIWRSGWPHRGNTGQGHVHTGLVVEWRWLAATATTVGDEAGHGIVELYQDILERPGFKEFIGHKGDKRGAKS